MARRAAVMEPAWRLARLRHPPTRPMVGAACLGHIIVALAVFALIHDRAWGAAACAAGLVLLVAAIGFRRPLGGLPALAAMVLSYEGAFAGTMSVDQSVVLILAAWTAGIVFACFVEGPSEWKHQDGQASPPEGGNDSASQSPSSPA